MYGKTMVVSDIRELVLNGDFSAWTDDNPDNWTVVGETPPSPEVSEVGIGEGHGGSGTGLCNIYTSDGTNVRIQQEITLVKGRKYNVSLSIDTIITGGIVIIPTPEMFPDKYYTSIGLKTWSFVATETSMFFHVYRRVAAEAADVTIDNVSIKPIRQKLPI